MKTPLRKGIEGKKSDDETLFGLLSPYKLYNTYLSLFTSEKEDAALLFITDNPKRWTILADEKYKNYKTVRRLVLGVSRLSIKYLLPEHLIKSSGPILGMKLPPNKVTIVNNIDNDGYFILQTPLRYLPEIVQNIRKIINMSPQKKYEILEKCLAENA
jgi:hypothetical protein